jgi:hypothetical protein
VHAALTILVHVAKCLEGGKRVKGKEMHERTHESSLISWMVIELD